ncbi:cytochrome b/b6 domain-containing protein [Edaphosphingomonas haloaromaticamans]|uniref:Prokaryotic cytochrome b561 n=1 Tax=Edaphosphingomonas haloaromaticamans TaxID=653954 RepID=A0A1S1HCI7_9SPHN|nr:Prokaryotic cytochrome b561 [Sphingomonas haloaromaticamans]
MMRDAAAGMAGEWRLRHRWPTRIWHWANAAIVIVMLMSGLMIFNAHPRLYWGQYGANADHAWLEIRSTPTQGILRIGDVMVPTTGVLGRWTDGDGVVQTRAFPGWATIPTRYSLSAARRWHLAFAWAFAIGGAAYAAWCMARGHLSRDLLPRRGELAPGHLWADIKAHARLRLAKGEAAARYNILQKLSYLAVLFGLLPAMLLSGLAMSPAMDAAWPWLVDLFAGRQSARSVHFICAMLILAFVLVHLAMVAAAGPVRELRAMIGGWYRLPEERA